MEFDLLAAARDLIAADSVSANGNLRAVAVLETVAKGLGLETYRQEAMALGVPQANLSEHPKGAPPRDGSILAISQFTLLGDARKGKRPSFVAAMEPDRANGLFEKFVGTCRGLGASVETGRFGADMQVELVNDGPVTILLDTRKEF
jgi:hypothetical protein